MGELALQLLSPGLYRIFDRIRNERLRAEDGDYPDADRRGNIWANCGLVAVENFFSKTRNMLVQERIMQKYYIGNQVLLVPDPEQKDKVYIMTLRGKRLGLLPDDGDFTDMIRKRLDENFDVFSQVFDYGVWHSGRLRCEVRIVYYVTPFDKGIRDGD